MTKASLVTLLCLLPALPTCADYGDLFLDLGGGTVVQGMGRQPAMAGSMGFCFGVTQRSEARLGVDYGRFLGEGPDDPGDRQLELTGLSLAAGFSPYPGDIQPLLGARIGMTRFDGRWQADLGAEAQALAAVHSRLQAYASVNPGLWLGEGGAAIRVKLGLGFRAFLAL